RNFSIPPCRPASGRETHVADQKTLRDEKDRHCVARESAMHARASRRSMPDEAAPRHASRSISLARVQPDDRVAPRRTWRSCSTTGKLSREAVAMLASSTVKQAFVTNVSTTVSVAQFLLLLLLQSQLRTTSQTIRR